MNSPQNWPQQTPPGQAPPGGYVPGGGGYVPGPGGGGYAGPPPVRKKRTGLVVGIVVAVVVLLVAGVVGKLYLDYVDEPGGGPGGEPVAQCALSDSLKQQAHVSSFRLIQAPAEAEKGMKQTHCAWEQTKGRDGRNPRTIHVLVYDYAKFSDKSDRNEEMAEGNYTSFTSYASGSQAKQVDGLGDQAMVVIPSSSTDLTEVNLLVRKGAVVWNIRYFGRDKGFLSDSAFPVDDAEAVARRTAEELVR